MADSSEFRSIRLIGLAAAAVVLAVIGVGVTLFVQDWQARRVIQLDKELEAQKQMARQAEAMARNQIVPGRVRSLVGDPFVKGSPVESINASLFPDLAKEPPGAVAPAPGLEARFAAAFGPTGRTEARVAPSPGARLRRDFDADYAAYRLRDVDEYLKRTRDVGEARQAGETFLRAFLDDIDRRVRFGRDTAESRERIQALGVDALVAGSNDPLILAYYADAIGLERHAMKRAVVDALEVAFAGRTTTAYPAFLDLRLTTAVRWVFQSGKAVDFGERRALVHAAIARWLREESAEPAKGRVVWRRLSNVAAAPELNWPELLHRAVAEGGVDRWLLLMIAGRTYERLAWKARGGGYANTVKDEGWRDFEIGMRRASACFREAWLTHPDRPEPAWEMIAIANTGKDAEAGTPADWFEKSISIEFDAPEPYDRLWASLLPRWGGDHPSMLRFARACLDSGRFDTNVPNVFADVFLWWDQQNEIDRERVFAEVPGAEASALDFVRAIGSVPPGPDADARRQDRNQRAGVSILMDLLSRAGHADAARELALEWPADRRLTRLGGLGRPLEFEFARIRGTTDANRAVVESLVSDMVRAPLAAVSEEAAAAVRERLEKLREAADPDTERLAGCFSELLDQRLAWERGDAVEFDPASGTLTLAYEADSLSLDEVFGRVEIRGNDYDMVQLGAGFLLPFRFPLEVEAVVDSVPFGESLEGAGFQWNPAVGFERPTQPNANLAILELTHPFAGYARNRRNGLRIPRDPSGRTFEYHRDTNFPGTARWKLWPEIQEFSFNGVTIRSDLVAPPDPTGRLWVGEPYSVEPHAHPAVSFGKLVMGRVRLRKLTEPPPPLQSGPFEERLADAEAAVRAAPDNVFAKFLLAELYTESNPELVADVVASIQALRSEYPGADVVVGRAWARAGRFDAADAAFSRALDRGDFPQHAAIGRLKLHLERDGWQSPVVQEYKHFSPRHYGMIEDTYCLETLALVKYADYRSRDEKSYPQVRLEILREATNLFSGAVARANPGPRRDELTRRLAQWHEEVAAIEAKLAK